MLVFPITHRYKVVSVNLNDMEKEFYTTLEEQNTLGCGAPIVQVCVCVCVRVRVRVRVRVCVCVCACVRVYVFICSLYILALCVCAVVWVRWVLVTYVSVRLPLSRVCVCCVVLSWFSRVVLEGGKLNIAQMVKER